MCEDVPGDLIADSPVPAHRLNDSLCGFKATINRILNSAARIANQSSPIVRLPARALELVCQKLSVRELVTFSHVSWGVRARLLVRPQIWRDLNFGMEDPCRPTTAFPPFAFPVELLRRSAEEPLVLTMWMHAATIHALWPTLTFNMRRLRSLALWIDTFENIEPDLPLTSCPNFWRDTIKGLDVPAPLLGHVSITLTESSNHYGDFDTQGRDILYNALPLGSTALSWAGPCLETLLLSGVRLPRELEACAQFRSVTCFDYCQNGPIYFKELSSILVMMPLLVTLGLTASTYGKFDWSSETDASSGPRTTAPTLRNLYLAGGPDVDARGLRRVLPFAQLKNLDIGLFLAVEKLMAAITTRDDVKMATIAHSGITLVCNADESKESTTIRVYCPPSDGLLGMLTVCSNLTWIAFNELEWYDNGGSPVQPGPFAALRTLCISLATRAEYACHLSRADVTGIFVYPANADRWYLPNLKELHITAPQRKVAPLCAVSEGDFGGYPASSGMSVSLREIVRFVRIKLDFDAPRLAVRFAGLRFVDPDIEVAWTELHSLAETLDISETPDEVPHMDMEHFVGYYLPSLFTDRDRNDV
ncbi:hypothetical protein AURDEDRAFT_126817 [Auricularia subglabra TFB-10046 SS5]|nr:hypothetical protein AURDEDRAFT_126817 [Auricularia subglabra TFB-10046 SS5]